MHGFSLLAFVTEFGDQSVIVPFAAAVAIVLAASGARREALIWCGAILVSLFGIFVAKVFFLPCGHLIPVLGVRSPSGHTAAAAVVCGGLMAVLANRRHWTLPIAFLAAAVIGVSRLLLGAHVPLEVLVGAVAGIGGALVIAACAGPQPPYRRTRTAVLAIATLLLLHGLRLPAEAHIRGFAYMVAQLLAVCEIDDNDALWRGPRPPAASDSSKPAPSD
jgi:membrane-associated phospholipid phosphatase